MAEPLERALFCKRFLKMPPISLYWFSAQHQTSTLRPQKIGLLLRKI